MTLPYLAHNKKKWAVHLPSTLPYSFPLLDSSNQENLWHPEAATYRCFLPDLTGFIVFCRTGPDLQYRSAEAVLQSLKA